MEIHRLGKQFILQVEFFIPYRIKVWVDRFGTLFHFANLNSHVRITCSRLVFCYETLSTFNLEKEKKLGFASFPCFT